jgi:hypothetical protein
MARMFDVTKLVADVAAALGTTPSTTPVQRAVRVRPQTRGPRHPRGRATVTLGRKGMGDAAEEDFQAWCDYVCDHIDEKLGFAVEVERRQLRDVQDDKITADGYGSGDSLAVYEALHAMWEEFCGSPELWPSNDRPRTELQPGADGRDEPRR